MSEIITVRIDKRTKDEIRKRKIDIGGTVRTALKDAIQSKQEEELAIALMEAGQILRKIPKKEIIRAVRESRNER
ncbi:MAG TPA: hypothetical protein VJN71_10390 [Nitrososphaerales archaeon]|nr:hypothetical protein [Nitrososphaerales archaeon]